MDRSPEVEQLAVAWLAGMKAGSHPARHHVATRTAHVSAAISDEDLLAG